jgi:hypothetical protein
MAGAAGASASAAGAVSACWAGPQAINHKTVKTAVKDIVFFIVAKI